MRRGEKRERKEKKKVFNLSLRSTEIGLSIFFGARGKVSLCNKGYAWVPKSWSFVKLHKIRNFPTWIIFNLNNI